MQYDKSDKSVTRSIDTLSGNVVKCCSNKNYRLSVCESLTGGMICAAVTSAPGASEVIELGICSYTDRIKNKIVGVGAATLEKYTAVSAQTAEEMAAGVMKLSGSDIAVSATGIAGPSGGTDSKPVGTVFVSVRFKDKKKTENLALYKRYEKLDRDDIRKLTTKRALEMVLELIDEDESGGSLNVY